MGPEQLAGVLSIVRRQAAERAGAAVRRGRGRACCAQMVESQIEKESLRVLRHRRASGTTASSIRATPAPCSASPLGGALRRDPGHDALRRVPDVRHAVPGARPTSPGEAHSRGAGGVNEMRSLPTRTALAAGTPPVTVAPAAARSSASGRERTSASPPAAAPESQARSTRRCGSPPGPTTRSPSARHRRGR